MMWLRPRRKTTNLLVSEGIASDDLGWLESFAQEVLKKYPAMV